jgi:hypothetical protein
MMKVMASIALFAVSTAVSACSCEAPDDHQIDEHVRNLFASHEVVGVFRVEGPSYKKIEFSSGPESGRWYTLEPERLFKGERQVRFARAAPLILRSSCDVRYTEGDLVLVYATSAGAVRLSLCAHSGRLMGRFDHLPVLFRLSESWR